MAPPTGRKVPFSGKAKKQQLKLKKEKKGGGDQGNNSLRKRNNLLLLRKGNDDSDEESDEGESLAKTVKLNSQRTNRPREANRYALQFYKETKEELAARKELARGSIVSVPDSEKEIDCNDYFPSSMDIPRRPPWNFNMGRQELDPHEHRYFTKYVNALENQFGAQNLSYFELNLETWRQLWRVLEMSDIVLIIVDTRCPALMFPPSVYDMVTKTLGKSMILVLNKIDLVPPHVVVAWKHYFMEKFPTLRIITFTSFPTYNLRNVPSETKTGLLVRRKKGRQKMAAEGALKLYEACKDLVKEQVDLSAWHQKILEEQNSDIEDDDETLDRPIVDTAAPDTGFEEHVKFRGGILTIGCIGQPNVGKSSLMNAIMGKKVVSVSRTPGHTKHFQTIFLTNNVRLCDCPGLVFPSTTPRNLQILIGSYPIAQVREPFTAVKYLCERLDLVSLLNIQHPEDEDTWSAMDVCDGWAKKRGFHTAKAARLDSYRAANNILRMALDGKICLSLKPPGFHAKENEWKQHPEVAEISWIQARKTELDVAEKLDDPSEDEKEISDEETVSSDVKESDESESGQPSSSKPFINKFDLLRGEDE